MKTRHVIIIALSIIVMGVLVVKMLPNPTVEQIQAKMEVKIAKEQLKQQELDNQQRRFIEQQEQHLRAEQAKPESVKSAEVIANSVDTAVMTGAGLFILNQLLK